MCGLLQHNRLLLVAQRVAGDGILGADDADDIAGRGRRQVFAILWIGVDVINLAGEFLDGTDRVPRSRVRLERA